MTLEQIPLLLIIDYNDKLRMSYDPTLLTLSTSSSIARSCAQVRLYLSKVRSPSYALCGVERKSLGVCGKYTQVKPPLF